MENIDTAAGNRLLHFEDCQSAIDQLFAEALATNGVDGFHEFLDFVARFNNLSIYNAMLVRVQRPGSGAVASRRKWKTIGRHVKADAIPIVILRAFGPVSFVFEQGDTEGDSLPGEYENPLFAAGELSPTIYERTCKSATTYEIEVEETRSYGALLAGTASGINIMPGTCTAICAEDGKETTIFLIKVNATHNLPTRYATLAHELGHVYCGHVGADSKGRWPERTHLNYAQRELEAEGVAWLVCKRNGVLTKSREYMSSLMKDMDLSQISMYAIFEAANRVESRTSPMEK